MEWKGFVNLVVSAVAAGFMSFVGYFASGGDLNKAGLGAALGAAVAAAINHIRQSPVK